MSELDDVRRALNQRGFRYRFWYRLEWLKLYGDEWVRRVVLRQPPALPEDRDYEETR